MSKFSIKTTPLDELLVIRPEVCGEPRDYLYDLTLEERYSAMGIDDEFVEHNIEKLSRGTLRGLYFQRKESQAKLLAVKSGRALVVAVDLRPESNTFGGAHSIELNAENEAMLYIPPYFAHGFLTLEAGSEVVCNCSKPSSQEDSYGMLWDDEILAINWQFERYEIDEKRLNISQRDKRFPSFRSYNPNALWINRPKKSKYALRKPFSMDYSK